jgi:hypothetical protein
MTVFAAGQTDHDPIAVFDHAKTLDRFAHPAQQSGPGFALHKH